MSLESPQTYAEWFWAMNVNAQRAFDEGIEKAVSPAFGMLLSDIPEIGELPAGLQSFITTLSNPPSPGLGAFLSSTAGDVGGGLLREALAPAMTMLRRSANRRAKETWINAGHAVILSQRKKITDDYFYLLTQSEGYEDIMADSLYTALAPYPTIGDIITYSRYHGDPNNPKDLVWSKFNVPADDYDMWEWLSLQKPTTEQVFALYKRKLWNEVQADNELARLGWQADDRPSIIDLAYTLPNPMLLTQGNLLQDKNPDDILEDIIKADIHPDYAEKYLDGILTKPASTDIIAYELRQDPNLSDLSSKLKRIGIHPKYFELYKELAYQIPPVADIITMAVREAFTPAIASRFGQYEDLPPDFVSWVGKKGLSKEWAERYWAAHWSLPSPSQGFEMLHRGIITKDDLSMLLRALDIMPFWRDKLVSMAYTLFTRIDVRRMYRMGVLNEKEVKDAYTKLGYEDTDAQKMTDFVIKEARQTLSKFSVSDVINAFTKGLIDANKAGSVLRDMDIKESEIAYIISSAGYKKDWTYKQENIDAIRNLYKKGTYDEDLTRTKLSGLGLQSDYITLLLQQWQLKAEEEKITTWTTAQTLAFLKKGIISRSRARQELTELGYDDEHINVYIASTAI